MLHFSRDRPEPLLIPLKAANSVALQEVGVGVTELGSPWRGAFMDTRRVGALLSGGRAAPLFHAASFILHLVGGIFPPGMQRVPLNFPQDESRKYTLVTS